jgi:SAM-dependent methyltransferase
MSSTTRQAPRAEPLKYHARDAFWIYGLALKIACLSLLKGEWKNGLKLMVAPVGYWRFIPNAITWEAAASLGGGPLRILDVSSPKLISLVLGERHEIMAIDLDDPQLETRWRKAAELTGLQRYKAQYADGCQLPFADGEFDFAYSLSVIEHIPGEGDTKAVTEMSRVVRPGGLVFIEVPLRYKEETLMLQYDSKGFPLAEPRFYERRYSPETAARRLEQIPGLKLEQRMVMGENMGIDPWIATPRLPRLLRLIILPFEPFLAAFNLWLEDKPGRGGPLSLLLLYRKAG